MSLDSKKAIILLFILVALSSSSQLDDIAQKLISGIHNAEFSLHTSDSHQTMDCFKISYDFDDTLFGIFHTYNQNTHFSQLYYTQFDQITGKWKNTVRLSDRGSQGTVTRVYVNGIGSGFLVGYELENQNGNKVAIRYYENQYKLKINNFLYQYQLSSIVSNKQVRNVGTVSLQEIKLLKLEPDQRFNQYLVNIKFHYSPDGSHDFPGLGYVYLRPLRDFIDSRGKWIGGCFENYKDWLGSNDTVAEGVLRQVGCLGKIGQRDYFYLGNSKYYLYQCNINPSFDWYSWRIVLYSQNLKSAKPLPLILGGDIDIANPHISLKTKSGNNYEFTMTFFIPSQGTHPDRQAKPGESIVLTKFSYP